MRAAADGAFLDGTNRGKDKKNNSPTLRKRVWGTRKNRNNESNKNSKPRKQKPNPSQSSFRIGHPQRQERKQNEKTNQKKQKQQPKNLRL
jgi:hypothetical protein